MTKIAHGARVSNNIWLEESYTACELIKIQACFCVETDMLILQFIKRKCKGLGTFLKKKNKKRSYIT